MSRALILLLLLPWAAVPARAADAELDAWLQKHGVAESGDAMATRPGWQPPRRIVVDAVLPQIVEQLREAAPEAEIVAVRSAAEMAQAVAGAEVAIGRRNIVCSDAVLAAGTALRWVQVYSAGIEGCGDKAAFADRSILLTNMRAVAGPVMADHTMGMLLALTRGLHVSIPRQAAGNWDDDYPGVTLQGLEGGTMLIVGLGGIGMEVARRAHAFGMRVVATRATRQAKPEFVDYVGLADELPALIGAADVIVHTAPLTPATRGLFDRAMFARMKPGAIFINVARGAAVDTHELIAALQSGRLGGAAVDVTDPEPLPADHPLWQAPNIIITPHMSGSAVGDIQIRLRVLRENLRRYVAGERMLAVADPARGY